MKPYKLKIVFLLILSSLIFTNFQCNDCEDTLHDRSSFTVIPNSTESTFTIGDTLFLTTSFSSQIELELSGSTHDNSNKFINYTVELFEGVKDNIDAVEARDNFEFINSIGTVSIPFARTWEIVVENTCDENLCELEFGMIPNKTGYFGLSLRSGFFGNEDECQFLSLVPTEIESNDNNNFEIFNDLNLSKIRTHGSFYRNPELESLLYFFKVIE